MTNARNLAILTISAICFTACARNSLAQPPATPVVRLQESVFLDTDSSATKKLGALEEYLNAKQWAEAVQLANQILEQHGEKLTAAGTGRYIDLRTRCHALLATMDAEGLQALREQVDPQARQWLEDGRANHDEAPLRKIVKLAFLSSHGDDALATLGEMAFERGAYGDARGYWEMTLPIEPPLPPGNPLTVLTYPDTDLDLAELRARLVLCSLFQRDLPRFQEELAAFTLRHGEAEGTLAGQTGRLTDILKTLADATGSWPDTAADGGMPTFAGNASRNTVFPHAIDDIGAVQWTRPLTSAAGRDLPRRAGLAQPIYLSHFPVLVGDTLFVNDETTISAYDLLTGKPAWSGPNSDDATIYRAMRPFGQHGDDENDRMGIPRYTMTAHEGRLYARMGSPVTSRTNFDPLTRSESQLVCLDIGAGQGKAIWTIEAGEVAPAIGNWEFEGSPVVTDGKVYVALRTSAPQPQANVACFDAENGRLLWNRKVCAFLAQGGQNVEEVSHQLLTLGEGTLFYSTNQGAIAAVDAHDGSLNWVVTYERGPQRPWTSQLKNGLVPCLYHQGTVVAAPADLKNITVPRGDDRQFWRVPTTGTIMGIDAKTGVQKWSKELTGGVRHLFGVSHNRLIVSGDFLWAIDLDTGRTVWTRGQQDLESYGYGRGLLAGDLVMWPKRESIWVFDTQTGAPHAEIALGQWRTDIGPKLTGGNLLIAGGMLIVAQAEALVAYAQWGRVKKQLHEEISAAPGDPVLHLKLARAEQTTGDWEAALEEYRQAVRAAAPQDRFQNRPLRSFATEKLAELLLKSAIRDGESATQRFQEALRLPTSPELRMEIVRGLAASYRDSNLPRETVETWQEILNDPQLSDLYIDDANGHRRRAGDVSRAEIDTLLAAHGDAVYASIEERATRDLAELADDNATLRATLTRFPHAHATARRWLDVAENHNEHSDGEHSDGDRAVDAYERLLGHRDEDIRRTALWGMARTLEQLQLWREARGYWLELAAQFPEINVPGSEPPVTFASHSQSHLQQPEFQRQARIDAPREATLPLRRSWSRPLGRSARLHIPVGTPPALHMQSVIVADARLNCINMFDGRVRWQAAAADEIEWVGYAGSRLILSGPRGLEGVSLRTGQRLWRVEYDSLSTFGIDATNDDAGRRSSPQLYNDGQLSLACFIHHNEVVCARGNDGVVTWRFRPPEGTIQPNWLLHGDRCVMQTTHPARIFVLNVINGTPLADCAGPAQPWPFAPCAVGDDFLAVHIGTDAGFTRYGVNGASRWQYSRAISQTNAAPDFLTNGRDMTLIEDGDTLIGVGADDGKKLWSVGLGVNILPHARDRMGIDGEAIYAENDGILRCYQIDNGQVRWEQFLGGDKISWRVACRGRFLLASPTFHDQPDGFPVLFFDPATGALIQKLQLGGQGRIDVHIAAGVTLVSSADSIHALARM